MITRSLALGRRWFPERQFLLRSGERVRYVALPGWSQLACVVACIALLGGVAGLGGSYLILHKKFHRQAEEASLAASKAAAIAVLRDQLALADDQYAAMVSQLDEVKRQLDTTSAENDALRDTIASAQGRARGLSKARSAAEQKLGSAQKALENKSGDASALAKLLADNRKQLQDAEAAHGGLQKKLGQLQIDAQSANNKAALLKLALDGKERELQAIAAERDKLRKQLSQQTVALAGSQSAAKDSEATRSLRSSGLTDLEQIVASTGIDLDKLLGPLGSLPQGQGGPYVALSTKRSPQEEQRRAEELKLLVKTLPLAAPLGHYQIESGFGPRSDPFRDKTAFHTGVDLSAPYRSPVMSTAPGTVTFTGNKEAYGRVIEISHGHGIVTRYAHLHRALVAVGQKVTLHQVIGELGSTGRSTGPHVHYEVLVDGTPFDPEKFLDAGKNVVVISAK
jgi:murein DD-endopeptidase MepM/ murein hydrolase activator NlpD